MSIAWDDLSDSQKREFEAEYYQIVEWYKEQRKKREDELKALGKWQDFGLDSNQSAMKDLIAERIQRVKRLRLKYNLVDLNDSRRETKRGED